MFAFNLLIAGSRLSAIHAGRMDPRDTSILVYRPVDRLVFRGGPAKADCAIFSSIYAVANRGFYLMVFVTLFIVFAIIYITRWLDYGEVLPNEILHHHGPLSDLEQHHRP